MLQNGQVGPFGLDDNTNPPLGALGGGGSIRVLSSTLVAQGCVFEDNLAIDSTDQCWAGPWESDHQGTYFYFNDDDPRTRGNYTNARCDVNMDELARTKLQMSGMHFNGGGAISASRSQLVAGAGFSQVQITECKFQNNGARYRGGAIATIYTHVSLVLSTFEGHSAWRGGAGNHFFGSLMLDQCLFQSNTLRRVALTKTSSGAALHIAGMSIAMQAAITQCSFTHNHGFYPSWRSRGSAIYADGAQLLVTINDTQFADNWLPQNTGYPSAGSDPGHSGAPVALSSGSFFFTNVIFERNNAVQQDASKWLLAFNSHESWCTMPAHIRAKFPFGFYPKAPAGSPCNQGFLSPYYECRSSHC